MWAGTVNVKTKHGEIVNTEILNIESQNKIFKSDFDFSVHYFVMFCVEFQCTRPRPFFAPITVQALYDDVIAVNAKQIRIQLIELSTWGVPGESF